MCPRLCKQEGVESSDGALRQPRPFRGVGQALDGTKAVLEHLWVLVSHEQLATEDLPTPSLYCSLRVKRPTRKKRQVKWR